MRERVRERERVEGGLLQCCGPGVCLIGWMPGTPPWWPGSWWALYGGMVTAVGGVGWEG